MFSHEIDNFLHIRNWCLTPTEYLFITDISQHSQLSSITYNPFQNNYFITTKDGWNWTVQIRKD